MAITDRLGRTVGEESPAASLYEHASAAVKAACRVATTANITLSGLQAIDGVTVVEGDRVLVKDQTTTSENGIYHASSGNWTRSGDFDGSGEVVYGTWVFVIDGTINNKTEWYVASSNPITIDTTGITFGQVLGANAPSNAPYVTVSADATLDNERVLTGGDGVTITDGGAGTTVTVGLDALTVSGGTVSPDVNDVGALGTSLKRWADLFLATGGVIDFGGDVTITHSSNALTFAGGSSGYSFDGPISVVADPSSPLQLATKQYVDSVAAGLDPKQSVACATTANITLSAEQTIDGVLTSTSRVLVKNQTAPAENGIYVSGAGAWIRATDMDAWAEIPGSFVFVEQGSTLADTGWVCAADAGGTLGSSSITWSQFAGVGTYTGTGGVTVSGTQFTLDTSHARNAAHPGSSTDNAIARYDSTAGALQNSGITVDDSNNVAGAANLTQTGYHDLSEIAAPASPSANVLRVYAKDDGSGTTKLYAKDSAGNETNFASGGSGSGGVNCLLAASVATNALTISLKTTSGNTPSSGDPVTLHFRDPTAAMASDSTVSVTSSLSLTVSSGSTLGTSDNVPFRLWVVVFNDGGTPRLGVIKSSTASQIYPLPEFDLRSSAAEGGSGGADLAGVIYTGAAVTTKPYRILGFLTYESGLATAGAWSSAPSVIQMFAAGSPRPGDTIQSVSASTTTSTSITSTSYQDSNLTANITPVSAVNLISASWFGALSAGNSLISYAQLHRSGTALGVPSIGFTTATSALSAVANSCWDMPQSTSQQTYIVKTKVDSGGTAIFPNNAAGGGLQLMEVMA